MGTKAKDIAEFIDSLTYEQIPFGIIRKTKLHVMDFLGLGMAGSRSGFIPGLVSLAKEQGGPPECSTIYYGYKVPATTATLINGAMGHILDYDDSHVESVTHPSVSVVPAALAVGEKLSRDGRTVLASIVGAYEIMLRIGDAAPHAFHDRGFHATPVCGSFGATAAAGKLLGLGVKELINAFGICGSLASGLMEYHSDGSTVKAFQAGWGSHCGVVAALTARNGLAGPSSVFEGENGLYKSHITPQPYDIERLTLGLGTIWETKTIFIKAYPCCDFIHTALECCEKLVSMHHILPNDIERVDCHVAGETVSLVWEPRLVKVEPPTAYGAKFSAPYAIAATLLHGCLEESDFSKDAISDTDVLKLAQRVNYHIDPQSGFPQYIPAHVEIKMKDGNVYEHTVRDVRGSTENPISDYEVTAKFKRNVDRSISSEQVETLLKLFNYMEEVPNVGMIMSQLVRSQF